MDQGCDLSGVPYFLAVPALRGVPSPLGQHGPAPRGGRRVEGQPFRLPDQDGKPPSGEIAAPALTEMPEQHLCSLFYLKGEILKISAGISALILLESRDSSLHNAASLTRLLRGGRSAVNLVKNGQEPQKLSRSPQTSS